MRIAHIDGTSGLAGDMLLGAIVDAGLGAERLERLVAPLGLGSRFQLTVERVRRAGLAATRVRVHTAPDAPQPRSLAAMRALVAETPLPPAVAERAVRVFEALAEAEARVHGAESAETVHFHEVGAIDALVDVVGAVAGLDALGIASVSCGPITVGDGVIEGSHGALPAPGPATLELLRGFELRQRPGRHELATPTGAALVRVLAGAASRPAPPMRLEAVGYGAGAADPPGHPNVLRLWVGTAADDRGPRQEAVLELETQIDDCSPELLATAREALLRAGALDVISVPCHMKKGRTGLWIQVLARPQDAARLERLLFEETSTFGVRRRLSERSVLERRSVTVPIEGIAVRVKLGLLEGRIVTRSPELEDVRAAARRLERPVREIYERACAAAAALGPG